MPNDIFSPLFFALGFVLLGLALQMLIPGSRRMGWTLMLIAVVVITAPVTRAALTGQSPFRFLVLPAPVVFFPVTGVAAALTGIISVYRNNRKLRNRIYGTINDIQGFRLESAANRPIPIREPSTGQINMRQAKMILDYQKREHAEFLFRFRLRLAELAEQTAKRTSSSEEDLITNFFGASDISLIERQLVALAEQIGQPVRAISWNAAFTALLVAILPMIVWTLWALMSL
jgi:hypothetical protein